MSKNVLFVLTSHEKGWYLTEFAHPYHHVTAAGHHVTVCSISGGDTTPTPASLTVDSEKDPVGADFLSSKMGLAKATIKVSDVKGSDFDCVFYVGGHGCCWDFTSDDACAVGASCYDNGGVVAAVCHGPAALVNMKLASGSFLVEGKECCGFTNEEENMCVDVVDIIPVHPELGTKYLEEHLTKRGGRYSKADPWNPLFVKDGRLITGQNPASADGVGKLIVEALA